VKVITFSKKVTVITRCGQHQAEVPCNPGERLVFDNDNALSIQQDPGSARYIYEVTDLEPLIREMPRPAHWARKRVLFYRSRGIGDQLIVSAAGRFFAEQLGAEAFQLSDRIHEPLWAFNPYIGGAALHMPMHLDTVWRAMIGERRGTPFFAGAWFFESLTEWDSDSEQPNVYDRLFAMLGFDPAHVSAKFKRPVISLQKQDIDKRNQWLRQVGNAVNKSTEKGYLFFQPRATNKGRSLPNFLIEKTLYSLNEFAAKLQIPILVSDDKPLDPEIAQMVQATPQAINVATAINNVRLLMSVIGAANIVVGPDSSALHIAAAFETPAVGIWGPFEPVSRTKYYPRQIHLHHPDRCPAAPCFNYLPELPVMKCPNGPAQRHCECYEGVEAEEIFEALKAVTSC
jgi:ADP-heptose:LPS heptosyltransferase